MKKLINERILRIYNHFDANIFKAVKEIHVVCVAVDIPAIMKIHVLACCNIRGADKIR